jgi:hypothetical protein
MKLLKGTSTRIGKYNEQEDLERREDNMLERREIMRTLCLRTRK